MVMYRLRGTVEHEKTPTNSSPAKFSHPTGKGRVLWLLLLVLLEPANSLAFKVEMCSVCKCPPLNQQPFEVLCTGKELESIPHWPVWLKGDDVTNISLDMDFNQLTQVTSFPYVSQLTRLTINYNDITHVSPYAFSNLPALTSLSLNNNKLSRLNSRAFAYKSSDPSGRCNLIYLDLSYNKINTLPGNLSSSLPCLRTLLLNDNPLWVMDATTQRALGSWPSLSVLSLAETGLTELPDTIAQSLHSLRTLYLNGNELRVVPRALHHATSLKELSLNNNPIRQLSGGDFQGLHRLEYLNISSMPQLNIIRDGTFASLVHLKALVCSFNVNLTSIEPNAFHSSDGRPSGESLEMVSFRENKLETLSENLLPWVNIDHVELQENPWRCDCHTKWLRKLNVDLKTRRYLTCASPIQVKGVNVHDVEEGIMVRCPDGNFLEEEFTVASAARIVIIFGVVVVSVLSLALAFPLWFNSRFKRSKRPKRPNLSKVDYNKKTRSRDSKLLAEYY